MCVTLQVLRMNAAGALSIKRVVDNRLPLQDLLVAQPQRAEPVSDPAQPFTGGVRACRTRIGRTNDLRQEGESRIAQVILLEDGVERYVLPVVPEFAAGHVVDDAVLQARPVCFRR